MNFMGVGFFFFKIACSLMTRGKEAKFTRLTRTCGDTTTWHAWDTNTEMFRLHTCTSWMYTRTTHARRSTSKGGLTAHCMKRTDVSEEDKIRDILWLKGWLGGCCRCTYSERVNISLLFFSFLFFSHSQSIRAGVAALFMSTRGET